LNKKIGLEIDVELHRELLESFNDFLCKHSILVDVAEKYYQNVVVKSLFDDNEKQKIVVAEQLIQTLVDFVPEFLHIAILESKLE